MFAFLQRLASCGPLLSKMPVDDEAKKQVPNLPPALASDSLPPTAAIAVEPTNPHVALYVKSGATPSPTNPHMVFSTSSTAPARAPPPAVPAPAPVPIPVTPVAAVHEGQPTPSTSAAQSTVSGAIQAALAVAAADDAKPAPCADDLAAPRSEYMDYWAPRDFTHSALSTKKAFEDSLSLPFGERCMLERAARGYADPDAPKEMSVTCI